MNTETKKTQISGEKVMELIEACIKGARGKLPHGYTLVKGTGYIRVFRGYGEAEKWDRPGIEFRLDLAAPRPYEPKGLMKMIIKVEVDLPSHLKSNILVTGLVRDLQFYSGLWQKVGDLLETLEIVPNPS